MTSDQNKSVILETSIKGVAPLNIQEFDQLKWSVCSIGVGHMVGTGFLLQISVDEVNRFVLVTCHHVIRNIEAKFLENVKITFEEPQPEQSYCLIPQRLSTLLKTDADIDFTVIELSDSFREVLLQQGRQFYEHDTEYREGGLLIIQYPYIKELNKQVFSISWGLVDMTDGNLDLKFSEHTACTEGVSSGSPAILNNKRIYGIHRGEMKGVERNQLVRIEYIVGYLNGNNTTHKEITRNLTISRHKVCYSGQFYFRII